MNKEILIGAIAHYLCGRYPNQTVPEAVASATEIVGILAQASTEVSAQNPTPQAAPSTGGAAAAIQTGANIMTTVQTQLAQMQAQINQIAAQQNPGNPVLSPVLPTQAGATK